MTDENKKAHPKKPIRDPMLGRVLLERYEILRKIGAGGMGAVYVARQSTVGREVAVKVLRGDLISNELVRERFRREAEIIGQLRHPNTIQLIDYGETDDGLAIMVMELLVGKPLNEQLKSMGPLSLLEAIQIGIDVASSLAEAHEAGLVHRDLKPGNIFLVEVGGQMHAKVLDFGIARILDEEATRITSTGQVFGTPRYMSPEQGMATGEVDARSDLYSLGLIIYECLVGQPPFVAQTSIQYLSAHAQMPPPKLSSTIEFRIPFELEQLVDSCLAKSPSHRIQTAKDVVEALKIIATGVDQQMRYESGVVTAPGQSAIANLLPQSELPIAGETGTLPDTQAPSTVVNPSASRMGPWGAIIGVGLLVLSLMIVAAMTLRDDGTKADAIETIAVQLDSGVLQKPQPVAVIPTAQTADTGISEETLETDSGVQIPATKSNPDAGVKEAKKKSVQKLVKKSSKPKSKKNKQSARPHHALPGSGGITGPRGLTLDFEPDQEVISAAEKCKTSALADGPAILELKKCSKGCAVLLDGECAGRTPLSSKGFTEGNKSISVVCNGKVVLDEIARLRETKAASFSCSK
ncbi:MAG: serine/threonine-protein kinase [Myxococcota bacterium]|nr:serine/threonine-protein kinase [Myxococcota bacterium]